MPEDSWHIELEHIQSGGHWEFATIDDLEFFLQDFMRLVKEKLQIIRAVGRVLPARRKKEAGDEKIRL